MMPILQFLFKKRLNILHAIVLVLLIAISIYSTYSILYSYLFENITTKTDVKIVTGPSPLAEFFTVDITFHKSTVFPETWSYNSNKLETLLPDADLNRLDLNAAHRIDRRGAEELFYSKYNDADLSLEDMVDIASITGIIKEIDYGFLQLFDSSLTQYDNLKNLRKFYSNLTTGSVALARGFPTIADGVYSPKLSNVIDSFIKNPSAAPLIDKTLENIISPNSVGYFSLLQKRVTEVPISFVDDNLHADRIQFTIPLPISGDVAMKRIVLGILPFKTTSELAPIARVESRFFMFPAWRDGGFAVTLAESPRRTMFTRFNLRSSGVYSATAVRSKSDCNACEKIHTIEHCALKCFVDSVIELCGCVPLTYRRLYEKDLLRKLPFCTIKQYGGCLESVKGASDRCRGDAIIPCETHRNSVQGRTFTYKNPGILGLYQYLDTVDPAFLMINESEKYRLYYSIEIPQKTFVVFQQQFQNSWMEMLGQIGGNLGIFLAFSLYGMWQLVVLFYNTYKRFRKHASPAAPAVPNSGILTPWIRLAQISIQTESADRKSSVGGRLDTLAAEAENMISNCKGVERMLEELEAKVPVSKGKGQ